jgi:predicted HicB family RNase H-like nuclease
MDQSDEGGSKRLVSTRLPAALHAAVQQAADEELISSASWIRRAIAQAVRQATKGNAHG